MIQVKIFYAFNDLRNFSYLITDVSSGETWVIDPFEDGPIIEYIKKESLVLKGILNTHQHWDHIKGNPALQSVFGAPVIKGSEGKIQLNGQHTLRFMDTPGHTMDHQVFIWESEGAAQGIFSGDTLFNSGVGNCKNGGDPDLLFETTMKLMELPEHVILYPGHDYVKRNLEFAKSCEPDNDDITQALRLMGDIETEQGMAWTLGQEKKVNPFFRLQSEQIQETFKKDARTDRQIFKKLRSLRDNW